MKEETLVFAALGGLGEIGMNMALYGFGAGKKRQWIMIDCGVSFAGEDLPGCDLVYPDISFIEAERKNLLGIIITHAHEDHFGALADLWPRLGAPVYMTPFAANLLEARRLSEPGAPRIPVRIVAQQGLIKLGPFEIETIPVQHSIPEAMALAIRTAHGTVLHTGDWKIDETPTMGAPTDGARLKAIGDEGVLALVCDSTNVTREGISPSEAEVEVSLQNIIRSAKGRVGITLFASNAGRIRSIAQAAAEAGREVVVAGRALDRVIDVARDLGMLEGLPPFRGPDRFKQLARDKCLVLLSGSQGEPRAALARMSMGDHPDINFASGDTVIFSSRAIPGNEKAINANINNLAKMGIEIITDRDALVHVSGHPRRAELAKMYEWVRPQIAIPAHGEALHLSLHRAFARKAGVENVMHVYNGDLVQLAPGNPTVIEELPVGRLVKDGAIIINARDEAIRERKKLSFAGIVAVAFAIDGRGQQASEPDIHLVGVPATDDEGEAMIDHVQDIIAETWQSLPKGKRRDIETIRVAIERAVRSGLNEVWDKKTTVKVMILEV
jgi:ribonuclease J